jgi:predicted O-linked N-acetylglucosamine transferase (SPINDLY family)
MATLSEALAIAIAHHRAGRVDLAEEVYRRILAVEPDNADALHLLGVAAHQRGEHALAVDYIQRAIALVPEAAASHSNLGNAWLALGKPDEAVACYRRALQRNPGDAETLNNLGSALYACAKLDEAIEAYRQAVAQRPDYAEAHNNLGIALQDRGMVEEAIVACRRSIELRPGDARAHTNLGNAWLRLGKWSEAQAAYRQALERNPGGAAAYDSLGTALSGEGRLAEAVACYEQAMQLAPGFAQAHNNLGNARLAQGRLDAAAACYRKAVELKPDFAEAHNNLGTVCKDQGKLDEALACYRRATELMADYAAAGSNLLYAMLFHPAYDVAALDEAHRNWQTRYAAPLRRSIREPSNDRTPTRRLRVGYVSPDLRDHVVGRNLLPLLRAHDRREIEVFCYSDVTSADAVTGQFQAVSDAWRDIAGMADARVAELVRADAIDILVDLTLHMSGNRLLVFARKPAPVQVTFAGYPGTTGLTAIDYRLTDRCLDPPESDDRHYSERSVRLRDTFWCYDPQTDQPPVGPLPAMARGHVTFGCLNNFSKITAPSVNAWCEVLRRVDRSRITLLAQPGGHRQELLDRFAALGIGADRISFVEPRPRPEYLALYQAIDVGLDTSPYNGHTTSLDAFWMGVPVVTLVGRTVVGRAGVSQLTNLGLAELAADTPEAFVRIAVELASDLPRLAYLRATLRERMQRSPLMDAPRFARSVEAAFRMMWRAWCERTVEP